MYEAPWYDPLLNSLLGAFVGAFVVYLLAVRQLGIKRRQDFRERQLSEFYAPMAGWRKRILAKSELRVKIHGIAGAAWQDLVEEQVGVHPKTLRNDSERFKRIISSTNKEWREELLPLYHKMLDTFTDKYWLAEPDTREFYGAFLEFVAIWDRSMEDSLPGEVLERLGHTEENVKPFYDHIERKFQEIQDEILRGK